MGLSLNYLHTSPSKRESTEQWNRDQKNCSIEGPDVNVNTATGQGPEAAGEAAAEVDRDTQVSRDVLVPGGWRDMFKCDRSSRSLEKGLKPDWTCTHTAGWPTLTTTCRYT